VSEQDRREQPAVFAAISPDQVRGIQAAYYTSLSFVDHQVGRLIRALGDCGLSDQTLVVYVGDNGYMLGQHGRFEKHCFYEPAVRIPLIMRWSGRLESNRRISGLVEMVDVLPTILHIMQLPIPPWLQGADLEPLIQGKPWARAHEVVFSEYLENEEAMVRSARFKLIVGTGRRRRQDGYQTGRPLPGPYERLYDLVDDPEETRDLSQDPRHGAVKDELLRAMYLRMVTTREGLQPVPPSLERLDAIHWCLVPRDR
jgi:choline-sulfatase